MNARDLQGILGGFWLPPLLWLFVSPCHLPVLACVCQWCCRDNPQVSQGSSRSMEQQAGWQMAQGQRGRVTSLSIKLSPVAPSATGSSTSSCSVCSQLCLLPPVPDAGPRSSLCVPIPGSPAGTGASPAGWDELLRGAISAAGDRKYPAALCGAGKFLTLRVRSSAVHTVIKFEIWGNNTTPSPLAVHIHWHRLPVAIQIRAVLPRCFSHQAVIPAPHGQRDLLVPRCLPAPHTSQGEQAAPPTPALGEGRGCTGCLLEPSWTCPHQGLHLVPA